MKREKSFLPAGDPARELLRSPAGEKKVYYKPFFYIAMASLAAVFFLLLILTNGYAMRGLLYQDRDETFMDFFNSLLYNINEPYENAVFYPPLSTLMYKFLLSMVPKSLLNRILVTVHTTAFTPDVKLYQQLYVPFIFYSVTTLAALYFSVRAAKGGRRSEKFLFILLMFFSAPMLFLFERANNIIIVLALCFVFITFYDDERSAVRRELALIALSAAIATKLYPIVFCALLLRRKKWKELVRVGLYSALLFIVPFFLFYDGLKSLSLLFANLASYSNNTQLSIGSQLNFAKMPILPLFRTNLSNDMLLRIGEAFRIAVTFSAGVASFFADREWKSAALCCCILYGFQGTCATYLLAVFFIPILLLLDTERTHAALHYVCLGLMILAVGLIPSLNPVTGQFSRMVGTKISSYAVMLLTFLLTADGAVGLVRKVSGFTGIRRRPLAGITAGCFAVMLAGVLFAAPGGVVPLIHFSWLFPSSFMKDLAFCAAAALLFCLTVFLLCSSERLGGRRLFGAGSPAAETGSPGGNDSGGGNGRIDGPDSSGGGGETNSETEASGNSDPAAETGSPGGNGRPGSPGGNSETDNEAEASGNSGNGKPTAETEAEERTKENREKKST